MNNLHKLTIACMGMAIMAACTKYERPGYSASKPATVEAQENIDAYPALKTYINRASNPNFKLGVALGLNEYVNKTVKYRLANRNFDEIVLGYEMKHMAVVQDDGKLALDNVNKLLTAAKAAGTTVYGHTLCWHANQNAKYLNSLIAPLIIPATGGPTWDLVTSNDFETSDASNYQYTPNDVASFTAAGQGANGTGRALKITNTTVRTNDWDVQLFVKFAPAVQVGEQYELSMDVRADAPATAPTQAHTAPGAYKFYDFFGQVPFTTTWTKYTKQITVTSDMATATTIAFNLGKVATNYYFDNITIKKYNLSGGVSQGNFTVADFESDNLGTTYPMTGNSSATVVTDPKGVSGKVLNVGNAATPASQSHPKFNVNLSGGVTLGDCQSISLDFYGTGSTGLFGSGMRVGVNDNTLVVYGSPSSFGCPDGDWGRGKIVLPIANLALSDAQKKLTSFTLAVGSGTGSGNYYIDNVSLQWKTTGDRKIEKTPQQKDSIINAALDTWIAGMVGNCKSYVKAWDVINEPMDDGKPAELKTGIGRTDLTADNFFWQDYLGKDYAVRAFKMARKYGNAGDLLFINDYNLEYNLNKCQGLIDYVKYIESNGAKVDGIGSQMHISITTNKDNIAQMFKMLAATGKLVKVSELDISVGVKTTEATPDLYQKQAEMYKYVIDKYFELVPAAQRYGLTIWSPLDSPAGSGWLAGQPVGIWTEGYVRKLAYSYVAEALKANAK